MKKLVCIFVSALAILGVARADAYVDRGTAVVRVMNKAAGKAYSLRVPVGQRADFEKLKLTVRSCKQTDPFQAEDFFMFIEVAQDKTFYSGWMSRNEPGNNPLQHPDYDLWLVRCE
ncbi:DUF2155 domain-containing protein [bacterium]|nr:DUF2155 domain-containing protein [bacterium]